ncbi:MAG: hypothetical protein ACE5ET_00570 [Gammaproteobacteria bacterium]
MKSSLKTIALTVVLICTPLAAGAEESGPAFSYSLQRTVQEMPQQIDNLLAWARGELAEHTGEGLFEQHAEERQVIEEIIKLAASLQKQAKTAWDSGEKSKGRALYYAAEATARYAAQMPHMLEDRLEE